MHPLLTELELEHGNLRKVLMYLGQQLDRLEQEPANALANILLALEYLHLQPEIAHHINEELIEKKLLDCGTDLPAHLLTVHEDHGGFEDLVNGLIDLVRNQPKSRRIRSDLEAYLERYQRHMDWEEQYLMPLAGSLLDDAAWSEIEADWVQHPDPVFGSKRRKRFLPLSLAIHSI